jgi:hypothetical protein
VNIHTSLPPPVSTISARPRLLTKEFSNRRATWQRGCRMGSEPCDGGPFPPRGPRRGRKATPRRTQLQARCAERRGACELTTTDQARASPPSDRSVPECEHCSSDRGNRVANVAQQNEQKVRKVAQIGVRRKTAWVRC